MMLARKLISSFVALSFLMFLISGCEVADDATTTQVAPQTTDAASVELDWHDNYEAAQKEAADSGKLVMANFTGSDWCPYCILLDKEVFRTQEFADWAEGHVSLLKVDFPNELKLSDEVVKQNEELMEKYKDQVPGYPTILFLDKDGGVVGKMSYQKGGPSGWLKSAEAIVHGDGHAH